MPTFPSTPPSGAVVVAESACEARAGFLPHVTEARELLLAAMREAPEWRVRVDAAAKILDRALGRAPMAAEDKSALSEVAEVVVRLVSEKDD